MSTKNDGMTLVCTNMLNHTCMSYKWVPDEDAEKFITKIMTGSDDETF
jgi:hypothetical protein